MNYGIFGESETSRLTIALLKARKLGQSRPQLNQFLGNVWTCSTIRTKKEDIRVIEEERKLYPNDPYIGYILAHLYFEYGRFDDAARILRPSLSQRMPPKLRDNFDNLRQRFADKGMPISPSLYGHPTRDSQSGRYPFPAISRYALTKSPASL